jgi:uncharacterized protein
MDGSAVSAMAELPTLNNGLLATWDGPLGWLIVARPMRPQQLDDLLDVIDLKLVRQRSAQARSVVAAITVERLEKAARHLQRSVNSGLWAVEVHAGARDEDECSQVASLLAASFDVRGTPYAVQVEDDPQAQDEGPWTRVVGSEMLARLCAVPVAEVPGIRLVTRSTFDVTPEAGRADDGGPDVFLGSVLDHQQRPADDFPVALSTLNRHAFICGATGSGKSQTTRHLLAQLTRAGIPWLVVEPAKAEYRRMGARMDATAPLVVIRPGDPDQPPAGLNPLAPEPGFPLQTHVDLVRALFLAAFDADEPFPQVLAASLTRCYERLGWDLALSTQRSSGDHPSYPLLADLQETARRVVDEVGYGAEVRQNVSGFMEVRLSSLRLGTPGRFFEGGHPIDVGALLRTNCVIEIEDVGDDQDKAFLMGTILIRLVEHLRLQEKHGERQATSALDHVTVFEEAHRLLRRVGERGAAAHAVELFASLLAEVRAYGEGIVVVEQIPAKLLSDVVKNTALKVVHRLPALDDRELVGATMNLAPEQSDYVVTLTPGRAACFADGMDHPLLVEVPDGTANEAPVTSATDPTSVIGRRTPLCGAECQARPCTMAEMREAQHELRGDLLLWLELLVVAHITGMSRPGPGAELRRQLRSLDGRCLECALAQGIEAAVTSRATGLVPDYPPMALATHVLDVARAQLAAEPVPGGREEWRWQAGPFRWYDVHRALRARIRSGDGEAPHPLTGEWERRYNRKLVGATCTEQERTLVGWQRTERGRTNVLLFGSSRRPGLAAGVGASPSDAGWSEALGRSLRGVELASPWPLRYLAKRS